MKFASFSVVLILSLMSFGETSSSATNSNDQETIESRERLARRYAKLKKWNKAIELLNSHTDLASPRGHLVLATAYMENKDFKNVVRIMTLLSQKLPKDPHIHFMLGDALIKQARAARELSEQRELEAQGIESFRATVRLNKNFRPAHEALVNYFWRVGMNLEARNQINDMMKIFGPRSGDLHADLCRLYALDGYLQQAIRHCSMARELNPALADSYVYLAQAYFDQTEMEKAEKTLIAAAKKFPTTEFVQYGAGQFFLKKNNFPVAMKYLKRAVRSDGTSPRSQLALAQSLFSLGREEDSLPHFTKACQLNSAAQSDVLAAASRLRLKGSSRLAARFSQAAGSCRCQVPSSGQGGTPKSGNCGLSREN